MIKFDTIYNLKAGASFKYSVEHLKVCSAPNDGDYCFSILFIFLKKLSQDMVKVYIRSRSMFTQI